ncbi:uncharacterized protein FA14DRAFT_160057 [Meira miltonrushii]|uniref:Uncharacterized protein n=1 Tax=Meira miltonrushii TaxID=1280837 RepID=A0A316VLX4_9BASI|nr:uncharacterized protein FA14DRAFT_160057 [Meira miltonrushii]PWN38592.1 hypothetical protein FA14DRAFT_160057 [Meira miltonrushii]
MVIIAYIWILLHLYPVSVKTLSLAPSTKRAPPEPIPDLNVTPSPEHSNGRKSEEKRERSAILALPTPNSEERQGLFEITRAGRKKV